MRSTYPIIASSALGMIALAAAVLAENVKMWLRIAVGVIGIVALLFPVVR